MPRVSVNNTHRVKQKSEFSTPAQFRPVFGKNSRYSLGGNSVKALPLQERVRQRFRALVTDGGVPHDTIGKHLGLTRSAVTRLLNDEGAGFSLQHIERLCVFFQLTAAEIVSEPGARIVALNPLEGQLLDVFRRMTELQRHSLLAVLDHGPQVPSTRRRARTGRSELTEEQQLLVDLFARSNEQARSGILKTLRGTAKLGDVERGQHRTTE